MRKELKDLTEKDYWVYGITESDFDYTISLVRNLIQARSEQYERKAESVRASSDHADDVLDDVAYYKNTENLYLWQFSLWRLQGLIEAVISHQLIIKQCTKKLFGLKHKLNELKRCGYTVEQDEIDELLLWASLRNAISHAPPEQHRPVIMGEADIVEYCEFIRSLYVRWKNESPNPSQV